MHTTDPRLMHADGSLHNYYDVEVVSPGCHDDAYDGALGQTYQCKYAGGEAEAFAWSVSPVLPLEEGDLWWEGPAV